MESRVLGELDPKIVWELFEKISSIPRPSKKEEKIRSWVKSWAKENEIFYKEDEIGNLLLFQQATENCEDFPGVVLQTHLDMVTQKVPESPHDFDNDPIPIKIVDDFITADGTTLGADSGIGIAIALATLVDPELKHGPLEVLLTVDEETCLTGAFAIKTNFFSHKLLLNLDSEDEGEITISSAGGGDSKLIKEISRISSDEHLGFRLSVGGLAGGHSGVDIHLPRINAIKLMVDGLEKLNERVSMKINNLEGGSAHNAIPRDCICDLVVARKDKHIVDSWYREWLEKIEIYREQESNITIELKSLMITEGILESEEIFGLLKEIPHGPIAFSKTIPDLVETSNNLAIVRTDPETIEIVTSTRSSVDKELHRVRSELSKIGDKYGARVSHDPAYPGWKPELDSPFLQLVKNEYEKEYGKEVKLKAIHAGLECGLFKGLDPELQIVSLGPEIKDGHSPNERVYIKSVNMIYIIVKSILMNLNQISVN